jgi:tape measure domain-containing protein
MSLRVSGKSAQEASGALLQLSQLLSGSMVQSQEYNSLIDGAYPLLQAVAAGLKEAGGDVGRLTALVKSGKVPTKAFFDAFLTGADSLRDRLAGSELTISSSFVRLRNVLIDVATDFNKVTGVSKNVTDALNGTADAIDSFDVAGFVTKIETARNKLHSFLSELGNSSIFAELNKALGNTDEKGNPVPLDTKEAQDKAAALERQVKLLQDRIAENNKLEIDNTEALARLGEVQKALATVRGQLANMPASVPAISVANPADTINKQVPFNPLTPIETGSKQHVSLADYPLTGGSGGGKGRGGGGGGRKAEKDAAKDLIAELERERSLIGATDLEKEKSNALRRAGANATEAEKAKIGDLVTQIHNEKEAREQQQAAMERVNEAERQFVGGLASDLMHGVAPADALRNALSRLADTLLNDLLDAIFQVKSAGSGGGSFLGNLFSGIGSIFGGGGGGVDPWAGLRLAGGGGVSGPGTSTSDSIPAMLSDGEYVVNAAATRKHRQLLDTINSGRVPHFAKGGPANGIAHASASMAGNNSFVSSPTINITMPGATGGPEDQEHAQNVAKQVHLAVRAEIAKFAREQTRNGGMLRR